MSRHTKPIDPGPSTVLDLSGFDVMELGTLVTVMREGYMNVPSSMKTLYDEIRDIYIEVRSAFLREFFKARR